MNCLNGKEWNVLEMFAYPTVAVAHFTDQNWILNLKLFWWCVMVCKIFFCSESFDIPQKPGERKKDRENWQITQKAHFCVPSWSLPTILHFSIRETKTQRYFKVSSPSSRRDNNKENGNAICENWACVCLLI